MKEDQANQEAANTLSPAPEDVRDCLQCMITIYGETQIDTLARLLDVTSYAEITFANLSAQRRLR